MFDDIKLANELDISITPFGEDKDKELAPYKDATLFD